MAYPLNVDLAHQPKSSRHLALSTIFSGIFFVGLFLGLPLMMMLTLNPEIPDVDVSQYMNIYYISLIISLILSYKAIILIPHFVILIILNYIMMAVGVIGVFATLILGRYPKPLENFMIGYFRWNWKVGAYFMCLSDKYPDYTFSESSHPAKMTLKHEEQNSRLWVLGTIIFPVKLIALIPHFIAITIISIPLIFVAFLGPIAAFLMGRYPVSFHNFYTGYMRWLHRVYAFLFCLTSKYPPFTLKV